MIMIACVSIHVCTRHREWGLNPKLDYKLHHALVKTKPFESSQFSSAEIWKKMAEISYKFPIRLRTASNLFMKFVVFMPIDFLCIYLHSIEIYKKNSKFVSILWLLIFNDFMLLSFSDFILRQSETIVCL